MTRSVANVLPASPQMPSERSDQQLLWSAALAGKTLCRPQLCAVIWPRLKVAAQTQRFHFFEPTLILVLDGRLEFINDEAGSMLTPFSQLAVVDQHVESDFSKNPPGETAPFRSLFLTFNPALIAKFNQMFSPVAGSEKTGAKTAFLPAHSTLLRALVEVTDSLAQPALSDERLTLRIFDLLMVLKEHGVQFCPPQSPQLSRRLMTILNTSPETGWTASQASSELAMSESTLRRKLKLEGLSFEHILLETRMHHALMLVQTTPWNMVQIADACGYKSVARFSERFKQRFGTTPARFR